MTNELKDAKDIDKNKNYRLMIIPNVYGILKLYNAFDIVDDNIDYLRRIIVDVPTITTNWIDALRYFNL